MTKNCCNKNKDILKKECPLCRQEGKTLHYLVVASVVKEDLQELVGEERYYICNNADCEVVFFNEDEEKIFLTQDINLKADFSSVSLKESNKCCRCK